MGSERADIISETGSDHVTMVGGTQENDDDVIPNRTESPLGDRDLELISNASNPLEGSEFFDRCKVHGS